MSSAPPLSTTPFGASRLQLTLVALMCLWTGALPGAALAQAVPDAGSLRQQIEQQRERPLPLPERPQRAPVPPEIRPPSGATVAVKAIRFAGNTLVPQELLVQAVAPFVDRTLDFSELQRATDAVAAVYTQAGRIARVYIPEQDVSDGFVTLQIIEARFGGVRFEGERPKRVLSSEIEAYFSDQQAVGELLNTSQMDRALLLVDDLPGVSIAGTLAPGSEDGSTDLVLQAIDEPAYYGDLSTDNTGSRSTGNERLSLNMNVNSPGDRGELFSANVLHTRGSDYVRLGLTVPVNHDGLRLGFSLSDMNYRVLTGSNARGQSDSIGMDLSYPLVRSRLRNIYLLAGIEDKNFYNALTEVQSQYSSSALRAGLSGNWFDDWFGGGANSASLQGLFGELNNIQAHSAKDTIGHHFRKITYSLSRQQSLSSAHSLYVNLAGQHAWENLDSSERFFIGGISNVRAYPASEQGGDKGYSATAEWRWLLDATWVFTGFVDAGRVRSIATAANPADGQALALRGRGMSLAWKGPQGLSARLTWSRRMGENPKPTPAQTDSDGTLKRDRFWFNASMSF